MRSLNNPAVNLSSPEAYNYLCAGNSSSSGAVVNRLTMLGYPAVWRCVTLISNKVGRLELNVFKRTRDNGREVDYNHPSQWLLNRRPSTLYTPFVFKSTLMSHALIHGNAYAWIVRNDNARPEELIILNPESTFPVMDKGRLYYSVKVGNTYRAELPENILHIRGLGHDGLVGYDICTILRDAFSLGIAAQKYGNTFFRNNGNPGPTIITVPTNIKDKEFLKRFREEWNSVHQGLDRSHRVAILENGMEIKPFSIDHDSMQFLQTREFEVKQIASIFGVPAHKLGADNNSSYGSLESEERAFLLDCLHAHLINWEEECELKLLKDSQAVRDSHFIEFDIRSLEQADHKTTTDCLIAEVNNGLLTLNEARALLNLPTVEDGERGRIPANITYSDLLPAEGEEMPPAAPPPAQDDSQDELPQQQPAQDRLQPLLASVVNRFVNRLEKAAVAASKRHDWQEWVNTGLHEHRSVLIDSISPVCQDNAEHLADNLLATWQAELSAVTREQVNLVFSRIDSEAIAANILKENNGD